jgi:DNA (cytosine-5)-methyltransferase 1
MYGRLSWSKPAHTITTGFNSPGQGRYLHPSQLRTITPHEAARIQFFPDWFDFSPLMANRKILSECIGNAVPPKLAFTMACELLFELPKRDAEKTCQPSFVVDGVEAGGSGRSVA